MAWTAERVSSLKNLWAQGLSASQIAARLGGCTRNAVIGKVHRLKLQARATTSRTRSPWRAPAKRKQPRAPRALKRNRGFEFAPIGTAEALATICAPHPDDVGINRRPLAELESADCHWPIGDPRKDDFGFCGARALQGRPYCEKHVPRAYRAE